MAPHSSTLAWKIPWTEEPAGYSSWGLEELDTTEHNNNKRIFNFYLPEEDFLRMVKIMLMKMVKQ